MAQGAAGKGAVAIRAAGRLPPLGLWVSASRGWLAAELAQEAGQRRLFPWLAVSFGGGILAYFALTDGEPALWAAPIAAALCLALTPLLGARPAGLALVLALAAALLGFGAAAWRVARVSGPILARTSIAPLTGLIEALDEREEGARLIVRLASFGSLPPEARPLRVRVTYRTQQALKPGDFIVAKARLLPPPEPARPGGYDFGRDAFFRGIGAVGSLLGPIEVRPAPEPVPPALRLSAAIDGARNALTRRITDANGGQAGAVAAALVTGKRGLIAPETNDVLRAAGIYHVVSISGLHMVLAAGVVFWLVRSALALVPHLALLWPIKKIAAGFAMTGVTAYCAFSGWDVAAERALIMTLIMLGAILVDRPALSMRNLALAAVVALAREPEALLGPSFQMSFGAVAGLIACARFIDGRLLRLAGDGLAGRAVGLASAAVLGTLLTTLVAQIATAPFATFHFQTIQPFGLVGNALTLPLVSLIVMPAAVLGILAYPFALDQPVWWLMGQAVRGMLAISGWIGGFGQSTIVVPAFGVGALALLALGLLVAVLPVSRLRRIAIVPVALGLIAAAAPERHDIFIDREGRGAAVRGGGGRLVALGRPSSFVLEQWLKADGDARRASEAGEGASCDRLGCTLRAFDGRQVALARDKRALPEDCARADILITPHSAPAGCAAGLIIDRAALARSGAVAIRLNASGPVVSGAREAARSLPWRPLASRPAQPSPAAQRQRPEEVASEETDAAPEPGAESLQ
ncbi:ComEC/Rec2 family competence protein [Methylobacterium durans]|uniref:ComEC/Rec2 family competence protein n=1 Tax=Methylobacterium durans TaxID=2202825 RepID=UPI002B00379B|nr:ComEC/Rec2 family competence protein [Methylobacterium durans]MEA1833010.1 ComEC/Rec2 family competence protein [Methylobacterium durans]